MIMKKSKLLAAIIVTVIFSACSKDTIIDKNTKNDNIIYVEATSSKDISSGMTKTGMVANGTNYSVHWSSSDIIVINGIASTGISVSENAKIATFELASTTTPYCSIYPASAYISDSYISNSSKISIPAVQSYTVGSFDPAAAIMIGYSENTGVISFHHTMSYLKLTIAAGTDPSDNIKTISISGLGLEAMSGIFDATFAADGCKMTNNDNDGSSISMDCGSEGISQGTSVVIAIPAKTYSGLKMTITDINGHYQTVKSNKSFVATAGAIYPTSVTFNPKTTVDDGIWNLDDYTLFAASVNNGNDYQGKTVNLKANIECTGDFPYISNTFNGTFNGNDFIMTSSSRTTPLFKEIGTSGIIKNLTTSGSFISATSKTYALSAIASVNLGNIYKCTNNVNSDITYTNTTGTGFGGFVNQNGGTIEECVNNGNILLNVTCSKGSTIYWPALYGGGIAAVGHTLTSLVSDDRQIDADGSCSAGTFKNCTNNGNIIITIKGGLPVKSSYGGICGVAYIDGVTFTGCKNYGNISRISDGEDSSPYASCVAGILGRNITIYGGSPSVDPAYLYATGDGCNTALSKCYNYGIISQHCRHSASAGPTTANRMETSGGIVGAFVGGTIDNCNNSTDASHTGTIKAGWNAENTATCIGGIAGLIKKTEITSCSVSGKIMSYDTYCIGAAGGIAGYAISDVSASNCTINPNMALISTTKSTIKSYFGLCFGLLTSTGNTVTNSSIGANMVIDGSAVSISSSNYESYLKSSNYTSGSLTATGNTFISE